MSDTSLLITPSTSRPSCIAAEKKHQVLRNIAIAGLIIGLLAAAGGVGAYFGHLDPSLYFSLGGAGAGVALASGIALPIILRRISLSQRSWHSQKPSNLDDLSSRDTWAQLEARYPELDIERHNETLKKYFLIK